MPKLYGEIDDDGQVHYEQTGNMPGTVETEHGMQGGQPGAATGQADSGGLANLLFNPGSLFNLLRGSTLDPNALGNAPGSSLDTRTPDADRNSLMGFIHALQQQAATGGGAWESALSDATKQSQNAASALGQAGSAQSGYANALRGIQNAQGSASQRAVGEGNILRAQTQQDANAQLADILAGQQGEDARQAAEQAGINQGVRQAKNALIDTQRNNIIKTVGAGGQALVGAMSDGGPVPGEPKVFGDSEKNDTVPAMLSPGEIVIPRSIATSPDAARKAMHFVMAVKSGTKMAGGGWTPGSADPTAGANQVPASDLAFLDPILGPGASTVISGPTREAPSYDNGALMNVDPYNETRDMALANQAALGQSALGKGPTVAPQLTRNAIDSTMESAGAAGRLAPDALTRVAAADMRGGANAAAVRAGEQSKAMQNVSRAIAQQRAQDLAFAIAQQRALWNNTLINSGLDLQQQAQLRGLLSSVGQAAVAGSSGMDKGPSHGGYSSEGGSHYSDGDHGDIGSADYGDHGEESGPSHESGGDSGSSHYYEGGLIKKMQDEQAGGGVDRESLKEQDRRERDATADYVKKMRRDLEKTQAKSESKQFDVDEMSLSYSKGGRVEKQKAAAFLKAMRAA